MRRILLPFTFLFSMSIQAQYTNYDFPHQQHRMLERERYAIPLALGGNYTGLALGPEAQYYNPAALAYENGISSVHSFYYERYQYMGSGPYSSLQGSMVYAKNGSAFSGGYYYYPKKNRNYAGIQFSFDYSRRLVKWLAVSASVFYVPNEYSYSKAFNQETKINPLAFGISLFGQKELRKGVFRYGLSTKNISYAPYIQSGSSYITTENYPLGIVAGASYQMTFSDTLKGGRVKEKLRLIFCSDVKYRLYRQFGNGNNAHYDYSTYQYGLGVWLTLGRVADLAGSFNHYSSTGGNANTVRLGLGLHAEQLFARLRERNKIQFGLSAFFNERLLGTQGNQYRNLNWINTFTFGFNYTIE